MTTKAERAAKAEEEAGQRRADAQQQEQDRQTHLVDPLTHPSSGDPPPAVSKAGDRLGAVPMTRNAVADHEQAKAEGLEAAKQHEPTKAEKASAKPAEKRAEAKTQTPSEDGQSVPAKSRSEAKSKSDDDKDEPKKKDEAPAVSSPSWNPFAAPKPEGADKK